ncbi:MAG: hypothetical protein IJA02_05370 [Clostridia bacterium]|nr:hypothetical protein [Clostridia bacterium]MBR6619215.1 hypothetical protein [Clostridia bacterium]
MKRLLQYYMVFTLIICGMTLAAIAMLTVNEESYAMVFGPQSEKIQLGTETFGTELERLFTWIFSFLPFRG